ncbi:hypothetical protein LZZ85_21900 [Terrimonas sp. NA20]|uniref:Uncharacterized protein n=1 Tax=Terrimonas ginsenosidimutans TaxID=2908004 RepID=A0ABS9KXC1_9BACT|nr:hypothetical protein [Terrimonas ginsenosidimutans]MCG2616966.1 hypothetical protein [Terrimonas ginsenosidimutans]
MAGQQVLEELKNIEIKWHRNKSHHRFYYSELAGELLLLRLNDFPDEPLLTLIKGQNIWDIDDVPEKWNIPFR